jgi:Circularly permutated YpsA SLOG family
VEVGNCVLKKIISGGQTGADCAGLDYAISHEIPHGGWCPKGRLCDKKDRKFFDEAGRASPSTLPRQSCPYAREENTARTKHLHNLIGTNRVFGI